MLKLKKKAATMGIIHNRVEVHGDEDVTAFDFPFDLLLDPDELNELLDDKHAHRAIFNTKGDVKEPMFPKFAPFALTHDLQGQSAAIYIGHGSTLYEVEFEKARLKGITLKPLAGGETHMTFKLQACPAIKHVTKLINAQKTSVKLSVGGLEAVERSKRQQDLPLGAQPEGEGTNGEDASAGETQAAALASKPGDAPIDGTTSASRAKTRRAKASAAGDGVH